VFPADGRHCGTGDQKSREKAKRLKPVQSTLRELFVVSGNRCAFPKCDRPIIDENGNFSAQVCHIEAAEEGGERFNPNQTNEERRHISNLMLLCYPHHVETDKEEKYPAELMRQMKLDHEAPFREGWNRVLANIEDWTETTSVTHPTTLRALSTWANTLEEAAEYGIDMELTNLRTLSDQIQQLTRPARQLFRIILNRGEPVRGFGGVVELRAYLNFLRDATGLGQQQLSDRLHQLEQVGVAVVVYDDAGVPPYVDTRTATGDFPSWSEIRQFCRDYERDLEDLIVDLRFDLFD